MSERAAFEPFATTVSCQWCGADVSMDVRAVELRDGMPFIACTKCSTPVRVPTFSMDAAEYLGAPPPLAPLVSQVEVTQDPPPADPDEPQDPEDGSVGTVREERRQGRSSRAHTSCQACGASVELDPRKMRLRWTHAALTCPSCGAEVRARRDDAFRNTDTQFPWTFTCYGADGEEETSAPPPRSNRIFRRKSRG